MADFDKRVAITNGLPCITTRAACAVKELKRDYDTQKQIMYLSFGHFWTTFGCFSDSSNTITDPLHTQEHLWMSNDCANNLKKSNGQFEKIEIFIERS